MEMTIGKIQKMTSPNPFALVTSGSGEHTNVMALSWWTFVSNKPPMLAICVSKKGYTHELLDETGEFGLHLVGEEYREKAVQCGRYSGRNVDKIKELGIVLRDAAVIQTKLLSGCRLALECKAVSKTEASDHWLYMAEIVEAHAEKEEEQLFAWEGYGYLDTIGKK